VLMDGVSGEEVVNIPCGDAFVRRFGNPYALAHRADVHGALLDACRAQPRVELRTASRVTGFEITQGVEVELETGERLRAAALVGADGIYSAVRRQIVSDGEPRASGAIIYRAVIPAQRMPKDQQNPWPVLWGGPGTHIIYYPLRSGAMFNFGATVVTGETNVDLESEAGLEEVLPRFSANCDVPLRVLSAAVRFRRFVIRYRDPVANWSSGPVTLLGDAAHPMVQYIAQGAAQALEDALCLAECAEAARGDFAEAFRRYQAVRIVRSARVQISSLLMDRIYHAAGVERLVRNSLFAGRSAAEHYERLAWLYERPRRI
jgi:2-polyprenyl-6-methoxyphenol hydroxylase-like FAD-dependent oxidoreductase